MKETPLLMTAGNVRLILSGDKTETRRIVNPQPQPNGGKGLTPIRPFHTSSGSWNWVLAATGHGAADPFDCRYGEPGDRLRLKESAWMWCERRPKGTSAKTGKPTWLYVPNRGISPVYAAEHPKKPDWGYLVPITGNQFGWRLKIGRYLPKWASRTILEIVSVSIERLHEITPDGARAEGCSDRIFPITGNAKAIFDRTYNITKNDIPTADEIAMANYRGIWESINGPGSWDANPWVWVIEFKRVESEVA